MSGAHPPVVRKGAGAQLSIWRGPKGERRIYIPLDGHTVALDLSDWRALVLDVEFMINDAGPVVTIRDADATAETARMPVSK